MRTPGIWLAVLLAALVAFGGGADLVWAAGQGGDYLSYQEPKAPESSWLSTLAYVVSLLVTFVLVLGLAFLTSRFVGQKMGRYSAAGDQKVVATMPLGANRGLYVVEVAGRFLVLGVTDHSVNLLVEISDPAEIERLRASAPAGPVSQFDAVFAKHLTSLQQMSQKFPGVFGQYGRTDRENDREKR